MKEREGWKAGVVGGFFGGGEGGDKTGLWGLWEIQGLSLPPPSLIETLVCVDSPVCFCLFVCFYCWLRWLLPGEYLKVLYHGSANLPYTLRIPLQILKRASLETPPCCLFVICILYTEQTNTCFFSESYIYSPSCLPQTQKVVVSSQLHWLLVCFGQLYNEIHRVRNWIYPGISLIEHL